MSLLANVSRESIEEAVLKIWVVLKIRLFSIFEMIQLSVDNYLATTAPACMLADNTKGFDIIHRIIALSRQKIY